MILLALLMCIGLTSSNKNLGETGGVSAGGVSAAETAVHIDVAVAFQELPPTRHDGRCGLLLG